MWMLNYPFPYDSARVQQKFTTMTHALLDGLAQTDQPALEKKAAVFLQARREFRESVPAEAEKYFAFQLCQEGVARYTEVMPGELAARSGLFRGSGRGAPPGPRDARLEARVFKASVPAAAEMISTI